VPGGGQGWLLSYCESSPAYVLANGGLCNIYLVEPSTGGADGRSYAFNPSFFANSTPSVNGRLSPQYGQRILFHHARVFLPHFGFLHGIAGVSPLPSSHAFFRRGPNGYDMCSVYSMRHNCGDDNMPLDLDQSSICTTSTVSTAVRWVPLRSTHTWIPAPRLRGNDRRKGGGGDVSWL
jgi:hypothetical protein